jgi:hypothetical protein
MSACGDDELVFHVSRGPRSFELRRARLSSLRAWLSAMRSKPDPERGNFFGSRPVPFRSGLNQGPGSLGADRSGLLLVRYRLSTVRGVLGLGRSEASLFRSGLHSVRRDFLQVAFDFTWNAAN